MTTSRLAENSRIIHKHKQLVPRILRLILGAGLTTTLIMVVWQGSIDINLLWPAGFTLLAFVTVYRLMGKDRYELKNRIKLQQILGSQGPLTVADILFLFPDRCPHCGSDKILEHSRLWEEDNTLSIAGMSSPIYDVRTFEQLEYLCEDCNHRWESSPTIHSHSYAPPGRENYPPTWTERQPRPLRWDLSPLINESLALSYVSTIRPNRNKHSA